MSRAATVSGAIHLLILLALIIVIPAPLPPPAPPDDAMEVEFEGTAASAQKSTAHGQVAAPAEADTPATENPAVAPPKPQPIETAPPPLKIVAPPQIQPMRAQEQPKKPVRDAVEKARPLDTVRHQPNLTKNPVPDTSSLMTTLEAFQADQKQTKAPTHTYNPSRGGAHNAGGQLHGNLNSALSEGQRKTIGDSVKPCYSEDTAAKDYASFYTDMVVTVDATGVVRDVKLEPVFLARAARDPAFRAFAERAEHAVLSPQCAHLPIPPNLLGQPAATFSFRFRP